MRWVRRILWGLGLVLLVVVLARVFGPAIVEKSRNETEQHSPYPVSLEAAVLHDRLIIGDWHADSLLWNRDLLDRSEYGHVDFPRLQEGNVAIQVFTAVTKSPRGHNYERNLEDAVDNIALLAFLQAWPLSTWTSLTERALYQAELLNGFARRANEPLVIVRTRVDLDEVVRQKRAGEPILGTVLGLEGGHALDGDLKNLDRLYAAGYRLIGLHHFFDNRLGGSLHGETKSGLTEFGRAVVRRALELHMILDVAHSSPSAVEDVIAMTDRPIVLSHTGIASHCESPRNIPDTLLRRIADTGGVIGIGYWADVICDPSPDGVAKAIRAAVELLGENHVSLGSDYDGAISVHFDVSELAAVTQGLISAGLTEAQITKIMGGNLLRVMSTTLPTQ